jgi:RND superfamily putative drug exporter
MVRLAGVLERWTRAVLRFRLLVLACWLAVLVVGIFASTQLPALLSNSFAVPGTGSERARSMLEHHFDERPDGTFTVVFPVARPTDSTLRDELQRRLDVAARSVPGGHALPLRSGVRVLYGDIATTLPLNKAKGYTDDLRRVLRTQAGPVASVTGAPAIQHDVDPIVSADLRTAELIALPIALLVLVAVFGLSPAVLIPFFFAACTIPGALVAVYGMAHLLPMVTYVTNLVVLIGLALAIDYSLLVVHRYRDELARGDRSDDAIVATMATAGRAVVFSGFAVAIGLAALLLVPVPFIRSIGVGGLLVPLVSIAGMLTLQPVLLSLLGRRVSASKQLRRYPRTPPPTASPSGDGVWSRLAASIFRRPWAFAVVGSALLLAAALPALFLHVTPGSISGIPGSSESVRGFELLRDGVGPGAVTPTQVVVDSGAAGSGRQGPARDAIVRLTDELVRDPEVLIVANGIRKPYVDPTARYARVIVVGRHEYGEDETRQLVRRLRNELVPAARVPEGVRVVVGGAPPQGADFINRTYAWFPWLVLGVLAVTYVVLLRAFRSIVLPLKAVLLNLLSVSAAYGLLVAIVQWGFGAGLLGLGTTGVEAWVPVLLFALLFGLSMDYEVFLVAPMREDWDAGHDNTRAVTRGLVRTGRIVTAAALIMVAVFSGFVAGSVPGLQQFGLGLALGILLDATIVRMLLVPSLMAVLGPRNWWLPAWVARLIRTSPSPL